MTTKKAGEDEDDEEYSSECEDDEDDEEDDDDDDEDEEDDDDMRPSGGFFNKHDEEEQVTRGTRNKQGIFLILKRGPQKPKKIIKKIKYNFYKKYNNDEKNYFDSLTKKEKANIGILEDKLEASKKVLRVPMRFKILDLEMNERTKRSIIFKLECLNRMSSTSGEYHKINMKQININCSH